MKFATSICMLGYTRIQGVVCFDSDTKEFLEITPAVAKRLIDCGQIKGLKWKNTEDGAEFVCDLENWNQSNIPVKTACGKFRPLLNDYPGVQVNSMYTVVRVLDTDYRGRLYEVVSNKCCRVKLTENNLRQLASITNIAGCWIEDTEIKIADGVIYENRSASLKNEAVEARIEKSNTSVQEPVAAQTLESLFNNDGLHNNAEEQSSNESVEQDQDTEQPMPEEDGTKEQSATAKKNKGDTPKPKSNHNKKTS